MNVAIDRGRPNRVTLFIRTPIITFVEVREGGGKRIRFPETQRPFNIEKPGVGKLGRDLHDVFQVVSIHQKLPAGLGLPQWAGLGSVTI